MLLFVPAYGGGMEIFMYKENVKPIGKTIFLVIGIIGSALLLMGAVDSAIMYFNLPYRSLFQLAVILIAASGVYILVRNVISNYEYSIVGNELIISSQLGDNEKLIAKIYIDSIDYISFHSKSSAKHGKCDGRYNAKKSLSSANTYVCFFRDGGKVYKLKFEPSEKLLSILYKKGVKIEG